MNKTRMNIFFILIKKQKVILFGESPGQVLIPPTIDSRLVLFPF